jgi:hypothetical protein
MSKSLTRNPLPRPEHELRDAEANFMEALKTSSSLETNEDETHHEKAVVYNDPPDRPEKGDINAPWGVDPNHPGTPMPNMMRFGDAHVDIHMDTRDGVIGRLLDSAEATTAAEQKLISENFAHGSSGEFTTHSLALRPKSKEKLSHAQSLTLSERLNQVLK